MIRRCAECRREYVATGRRASVIWCAECDAARIQRLDAQFKKIQESLEQRPEQKQSGDSDGIAPKSRG